MKYEYKQILCGVIVTLFCVIFFSGISTPTNLSEWRFLLSISLLVGVIAGGTYPEL